MCLQESKSIESKLSQLQELLNRINYPGNNDRHISCYIEDAEELLSEIIDEQDKISKLLTKKVS